jgi:hypothetical protein
MGASFRRQVSVRIMGLVAPEASSEIDEGARHAFLPLRLLRLPFSRSEMERVLRVSRWTSRGASLIARGRFAAEFARRGLFLRAVPH